MQNEKTLFGYRIVEEVFNKKQVLEYIELTKLANLGWDFMDDTLFIKKEKGFFDVSIEAIKK